MIETGQVDAAAVVARRELATVRRVGQGLSTTAVLAAFTAFAARLSLAIKEARHELGAVSNVNDASRQAIVLINESYLLIK